MLQSNSFNQVYKSLRLAFKEGFASNAKSLIPDLESALNQFDQHPDRVKVLSLRLKLALCIDRIGEHKKAIKSLKLILEEAQLLDNDHLLADLYNCIGALFLQRSELEEAINYFMKGLNFDVPSIKKRIYNNLGQAYKTMEQFDRALKYYQKSNAISREYFPDDHNPFLQMSLGDMAAKEGAHEQAIEHYETAATMCIADGRPMFLTSIYSSIGDQYLKLGQFEEAKRCYKRGLESSRKQAHPPSIVETLVKNINLNTIQGRFEKAQQFGLEAIQIAEKYSLHKELLEVLSALEITGVQAHDFGKAYKYSKQKNALQRKLEKEGKAPDKEDLLERKEAQISLLESRNKRISEQNQELQQIAHIIAHDLKAPLRSISGFSTLIKRNYYQALDEEFVEYFDFIINGAEQMHFLLTDLLDFVSVDKSHFIRTKVDARKVLDNVLNKLKLQILETKTEIQIESLPSLMAYPQFLGQIFQNLIQNAIKFRKPEGAKIHISEQELEDHYVFCIRDEGIGIDPRHQKKIFSIFTQLDQQRSGTGIGLAICKKMVQIHGGKMWVESVPEQGSQFYFSIAKLATITEEAHP